MESGKIISLIHSEVLMENKNNKKTVDLNINNIRELWSKTYNTEGKPDWSHIFPYYHPEIIFQDSIQKLQGIDNFAAMCNRLSKRCKKLQMEVISVLQDSGTIMMDWKMTMSFRRFPDKPIFGCTKLTLHNDGRIIEQRDYYDLWGDIFNEIPLFKKIYRKFMIKFFG
ncbi:MAG: nuclear transport factor 2 family protein [Actinomycetota bacterium]|nr:nuclear transport factor 2 family protein [Actinomycetota bacterium]